MAASILWLRSWWLNRKLPKRQKLVKYIFFCGNTNNNLFATNKKDHMRVYSRWEMLLGIRCFVCCIFFPSFASFFFLSFFSGDVSLNFKIVFFFSVQFIRVARFLRMNGHILSSVRSCSWWQLTNSNKASNRPLRS